MRNAHVERVPVFYGPGSDENARGQRGPAVRSWDVLSERAHMEVFAVFLALVLFDATVWGVATAFKIEVISFVSAAITAGLGLILWLLARPVRNE